MTTQNARYRTVSAVEDDQDTEYLFVPLGKPVQGAVRVTIASRQARPSSPKRHPKINAALVMARHFHPNHVVSVRLERSRGYLNRAGFPGGRFL